MEYEETYYGHKVRVVTTKGADGWRSTAEVPDGNGPIPSPEAHESEEDARRAALNAAMTELDRRRIHTGKP